MNGTDSQVSGIARLRVPLLDQPFERKFPSKVDAQEIHPGLVFGRDIQEGLCFLSITLFETEFDSLGRVLGNLRELLCTSFTRVTHSRLGESFPKKAKSRSWTSDRDLQTSRQASNTCWMSSSGLRHVPKFRRQVQLPVGSRAGAGSEQKLRVLAGG